MSGHVIQPSTWRRSVLRSVRDAYARTFSRQRSVNFAATLRAALFSPSSETAGMRASGIRFFFEEVTQAAYRADAHTRRLEFPAQTVDINLDRVRADFF